MKFGEGHRRACRSHPPSHRLLIVRPTNRSIAFGSGEVPADVHTQACHAVADLPQRKPEARAGGRTVLAVLLEGADKDLALDLIEVLLEVVRQRFLDRTRRGRDRRREHCTDC